MGCESFDGVRFDLVPLLQGKTRIAKLKSAYNSLIIGPRGLQCETNQKEIMGSESFDVVGFDLGHLLQGLRLLLVLDVCNVKPAYRKSWAANLLMWSDLTLGLSFKVKQG